MRSIYVVFFQRGLSHYSACASSISDHFRFFLVSFSFFLIALLRDPSHELLSPCLAFCGVTLGVLFCNPTLPYPDLLNPIVVDLKEGLP